MTSRASLRLRADCALVLVALVWGSTFIIVKEALEQVSTLLFLGLRFAIAAAALALIFRGKGSRAHGKRSTELRAGLVMGCFLFCGYFLQTAGLRSTTAAKAGFITGFYIPLVPVIGAIVNRRLPHLAEAAGVVMATIGMTLLTLSPGSLSAGKGELLMLGCSVAFAIHILLLGHYSKRVSYERLSVYQIATAASLSGLTFWWAEVPRWHLTSGVVVALLLTSLLATAFAFAVQTWAQQFTTPTRTALIFSLEPVFAWLASFLLAGEILNARSALGAALILAGILMVEIKPARLVSGEHL